MGCQAGVEPANLTTVMITDKTTPTKSHADDWGQTFSMILRGRVEGKPSFWKVELPLF